MSHNCTVLATPDTQWSFCPNLGAAGFFTALFVLTSAAHLYQAYLYRKVYCWVICVAALLQLIAYALRVFSIQHPANHGAYVGWFVLILVAPLWTNAFVYMVFGSMVWNYTKTAKVYFIPAWRFGLYFVAVDVSSFMIQVGGAVSATSNQNSNTDILRGLHIYMGGVGIQQLVILIFVVFAIQLHGTLQARKKTLSSPEPQPLTLLYVLYVILVLVTIRIIFRIIEYSKGFDSTIPNHEAFQYCLDTLPMWVALVLLNVFHPGKYMPGKECELPSRKERKTNQIQVKADKIAEPSDTGLHESA